MSSTSSSNNKEFQCNYCHREFRRLEHLQRHTRRHTHEKPFNCACGSEFSRRDLLTRHERIVHGEFKGNTLASPLPGERATACSSHPKSQGPRVIRRNADLLTPESLPRSTSQVLTGQPILSNTSILTNQFMELEQLLRADDPLIEQNIVDNAVLLNSTTQPFNTATTQPASNAIPVTLATSQGPPAPTTLPTPQHNLGTQIVPHFAHPVITESQRDKLIQALGSCLIPDVSLPSRDSLNRFLEGYVTGFYLNVPFTHIPTFKLETCSPELCLSMLAIGAACRYEVHSATKLFFLAKLLLLERQRQREHEALARLTGSNCQFSSSDNHIDEVRCFLCLCTLATWSEDAELRNESLRLRGMLAHSLRLSGLKEAGSQSTDNWETWAGQESERRTKLLAFCFLNIQSVAYGLLPIIWGHEFELQLPCSCPEWTAPDSTTWLFLRQGSQSTRSTFRDALRGLLSASQDSQLQGCIPSPVSNYVLLHGLVQMVMWVRILPASLGMAPSLDYQVLFRTALRRWTTFWQRTPESNLQPLDPNGPLPFTSSALLSLAYIRNCLQHDSYHSTGLLSWNPAAVADHLHSSAPAKQQWDELLAAHHATHVLEMIVKLGVQYVKHNQALVWSIETALCGLECAVYLSKWLRGLQSPSYGESLSEPETLLIDWIRNVVTEGMASVQGSRTDACRTGFDALADQVVEVWSHVMHGNSPWAFIGMVGDVLDQYRQSRFR
ncbi:hypothetical protein BO99DRAFT_472187 [Aspergillus violaceofuscus CBS 115571]|uniref:C2H2-type domain-containing protein n=1 Tax=Aspergillus violaceofuscus (strain CBS 115571) TaxID=1450538 RepID=A0A2V5HAN7_ASPV1|nr:hypothetical protein BO99DRAFT_472187 [Aspergillus violaceofuscus CBS 115571]